MCGRCAPPRTLPKRAATSPQGHAAITDARGGSQAKRATGCALGAHALRVVPTYWAIGPFRARSGGGGEITPSLRLGGIMATSRSRNQPGTGTAAGDAHGMQGEKSKAMNNRMRLVLLPAFAVPLSLTPATVRAAPPIGTEDIWRGVVRPSQCRAVETGRRSRRPDCDHNIRILANEVQVANGVANIFRQDLLAEETRR